MPSIRTLALAFLTALSASAAFAQQHPDAASMPMAGASMPHDCGKATKRHDHGAEKRTPSPNSMDCARAAMPPTSAASGAKKKPLHDHAAFHKNQ
jgi:hypothetical protein